PKGGRTSPRAQSPPHPAAATLRVASQPPSHPPTTADRSRDASTSRALLDVRGASPLDDRRRLPTSHALEAASRLPPPAQPVTPASTPIPLRSQPLAPRSTPGPADPYPAEARSPRPDDPSATATSIA